MTQLSSPSANNYSIIMETSLAWTNLQYEVNDWSNWKLRKKPLLRQLTGSCSTGTLNGLLGPSGAGKTTLLNCLSGNQTAGLCEGSLVYSSERSPLSYFIAQHVQEHIVGELTVRQTLTYAYQFKNGLSHSNEEMERFICKTLGDLLLEESILDRPFALCSGGEQKRVAIGQELMAHCAPSFLFLDEPTTGLDSAAALEVITSLHRLVKSQSITIIASIHAPNEELLSFFDQLYVLAKGGICIFSGAPGQIRAYLQTELKRKVPNYQPAIEVLLKIACERASSNASVSKLANQTFSFESPTLPSSLKTLCLQANSLPTPRKRFSLSDLLTQLSRQLRITFLAQFRALLCTLLLFFAFFALLGTIFSSEKAHPSGCYPLYVNHTNQSCTVLTTLSAEESVRENGHFLAYVIFVIGFTYMITSTVLYSTHLGVFKSEHRNGWYSLGVFYWSSGITSLLELSLTSALITCMTYFLSFQHAADHYTINWWRLGVYYGFLWFLCFYYQTLGQLIGILFIENREIAFLLCQFAYASTCLYNGLYVKLDRTGSVLLRQLNDWLGLVYLTRGIFYSIYGIDRCEVGEEYSWILKDYGVEGEKLNEYCFKVLVNIVAIRLVSLVILYVKMNSFTRKCSKKTKIAPTEMHQLEKGVEQIKGKQIDEMMKDENENKFCTHSVDKILIGWRNLSLFESSSLYEMESMEQEGKPILRNLNGQFKFGTLNALMGTSGAGKTSLLKVLNGRCKTRLSKETEIYLSKYTSITTCFITQEVSGHLMPGLTAKQMLTYASKLKNVQTKVDHEAIAMKWLKELDLLDTVSTRVEKCSGGERKRLAVALELTALVMPNCVCIDEPTSGLDSHSAETVISTLRKLTQSLPMTIITSIHQPTSSLLFSFDHLYVLARGGVCIFSGPPARIKWQIEQIPQIITQPDNQLYTEMLIKQSCLAHTHPIVQQLVALTWKQIDNVELHSQTHLTADGVLQNRHRFSLSTCCILSSRYLLYLGGYLWKLWLFAILSSISFGLTLQFVFKPQMIHVSGCLNVVEDDVGKCTKTAQETENDLALGDSLSYAYVFTNVYLLMVLFGYSVNFYLEYPYFVNEHRNGWYSTGSYYLVKSLFEIIPLIIANLIYVYIINIYDPVVRASLYWPLFTLLTLASLAYIGFAHICSLLIRGNLMGQTLLLVSLFILHLILGNFLIPISKMHYLYRFLSHFSISRFTFEPILLLQYGFGRCRSSEIHGVLYLLSLTDDHYTPDILMLVLNLILYRLIALYLFIQTVNPIENRRKRVKRIVEYRETIQMTTPNNGVFFS